MHIYAFGSICRGEIDLGSDVDLLACVSGPSPKIDLGKYSVYQYQRLHELWQDGNPFAWHLHLESKMIFSSDGKDFLTTLGEPARYAEGGNDLAKFKRLFERAHQELSKSSRSATFHLSCMFLALRNFATCYSLSLGRPNFSRSSPLFIDPSLDLCPKVFAILTRARLLSTRGYGEKISDAEIKETLRAISIVPQWMAMIEGKPT
jgi:hypothetical protein